MPAPGAASLLPQAETAMVIIEASARTASDVRIDARRACPPGAPERTMEGKARGRRVGAIGTFIGGRFPGWVWLSVAVPGRGRSEEHTSELQSLMRLSYAVFCLNKKKQHTIT